jgi:hypothetical protein
MHSIAQRDQLLLVFTIGTQYGSKPNIIGSLLSLPAAVFLYSRLLECRLFPLCHVLSSIINKVVQNKDIAVAFLMNLGRNCNSGRRDHGVSVSLKAATWNRL